MIFPLIISHRKFCQQKLQPQTDNVNGMAQKHGKASLFSKRHKVKILIKSRVPSYSASHRRKLRWKNFISEKKYFHKFSNRSIGFESINPNYTSARHQRKKKYWVMNFLSFRIAPARCRDFHDGGFFPLSCFTLWSERGEKIIRQHRLLNIIIRGARNYECGRRKSGKYHKHAPATTLIRKALCVRWRNSMIFN